MIPLPSRFDEILPADPHTILPNPHEAAIWIIILLIPVAILIATLDLFMLATFTLPALFRHFTGFCLPFFFLRDRGGRHYNQLWLAND